MRKTTSHSLCLHWCSPPPWASGSSDSYRVVWTKPRGEQGRKRDRHSEIDREKDKEEEFVCGLTVWIGSPPCLLDCINTGSGLALASVLHWPAFVQSAGRTGHYSKIVSLLFWLNLEMNGDNWVFVDDDVLSLFPVCVFKCTLFCILVVAGVSHPAGVHGNVGVISGFVQGLVKAMNNHFHFPHSLRSKSYSFCTIM